MMISNFTLCLQREALLGRGVIGDHLGQVAFFVMIAALFPLAVGPSPDLLRQLGPSIIWISALLSALPVFDRLFAEDDRQGWLEQVSLMQGGLTGYVGARLISWYLLSALPLLVITPILVLLYDLPLSSLKVLLPSLAIGTACLNLLGAISASLTLGARRATLLLALLLLPLSLPVLIFGVAITQSYLAGFGFAGQAKLLGAIFLFLLAVSPVATIAALRSVLEDK